MLAEMTRVRNVLNLQDVYTNSDHTGGRGGGAGVARGWQRHINITRNATGPKSGQKGAENFNLKGLHRLDINDYLFTFFLIWCN